MPIRFFFCTIFTPSQHHLIIMAIGGARYARAFLLLRYIYTNLPISKMYFSYIMYIHYTYFLIYWSSSHLFTSHTQKHAHTYTFSLKRIDLHQRQLKTTRNKEEGRVCKNNSEREQGITQAITAQANKKKRQVNKREDTLTIVKLTTTNAAIVRVENILTHIWAAYERKRQKKGRITRSEEKTQREFKKTEMETPQCFFLVV